MSTYDLILNIIDMVLQSLLKRVNSKDYSNTIRLIGFLDVIKVYHNESLRV